MHVAVSPLGERPGSDFAKDFGYSHDYAYGKPGLCDASRSKDAAVGTRAQHFDELFERHFDSVYSYAAYRVAPDFEAAKDITQDVFVAAFEQLGGFRRQASVLTWLRSIARNKVADYFRAKAVAGAQIEDEAEALLLSHNPIPPGAREEALLVSLAMRRLPEHYAEALERKYIAGLSVKEMASNMGMSEKAVESTLSRAREAFRELFRSLRRSEEDQT